jgi:hypothetical protein
LSLGAKRAYAQRAWPRTLGVLNVGILIGWALVIVVAICIFLGPALSIYKDRSVPRERRLPWAITAAVVGPTILILTIATVRLIPGLREFLSRDDPFDSRFADFLMLAAALAPLVVLLCFRLLGRSRNPNPSANSDARGGAVLSPDSRRARAGCRDR